MWIIESNANQLLVAAGIHAPPVPVEQVANSLGIKIELANIGEDCSGVLVRHGNRAIIGVNKKHPRKPTAF